MSTTDLDGLFAAVAAGDLTAVLPLSDALEDAGRVPEANMLRGLDCGDVYVVPALGVVTSGRPEMVRVGDRRGGRVALQVVEVGFGQSISHDRRTFRGRPMHYRAAATRAAFDRAVGQQWAGGRVAATLPNRHGVTGTRAVRVHVIDAAEYGLAPV